MTNKRIAYARVSTLQQELHRQTDALEAYGYDQLITEQYTGTKKDRDGLNQLLETVREGDTVIVESISRLGRKTLDILTVVEQFSNMGVKFVSLKESMDTSTPTGKAMLQMMMVIAELERNLTVERVKEGLASAKARGKKLGRPTVDSDVITSALRLYDSNEWSIKDIIKTTGVSQGSLYRAINKRKVGL
ncbi:recombinase family protein [Sporosarcina sp. SG10008]|uniref:recombinase family protein n=1 Tax=Sporosarcina sp. SG10008 TaxID=3373103 RepID=UPI0037DC6DF2